MHKLNASWRESADVLPSITTFRPVGSPLGFINKMAEPGAQDLSKNFLEAPGLSRSDGWSTLTPDRPLVVMKLSRGAEEIALNSP